MSTGAPVCVADYDPHSMKRFTLRRVHRSHLENREQGTNGALQMSLKIVVSMLPQGMAVVMTMWQYGAVLVNFARERVFMAFVEMFFRGKPWSVPGNCCLDLGSSRRRHSPPTCALTSRAYPDLPDFSPRDRRNRRHRGVVQ